MGRHCFESGGPLSNEVKKALSAAKLSEVALVDPKRSKSLHHGRTMVTKLPRWLIILSLLITMPGVTHISQMLQLPGLVGYRSDVTNKYLWMVRIGVGVFPHIKEPDYLVS
ncbi:hypothetical protein C5167_026873 [Papaver somniferum]|nr:hypothetical protein C5167_026873 [Papaver somniferum]